jgi:hypothetical protein
VPGVEHLDGDGQEPDAGLLPGAVLPMP